MTLRRVTTIALAATFAASPVLAQTSSSSAAQTTPGSTGTSAAQNPAAGTSGSTIGNAPSDAGTTTTNGTRGVATTGPTGTTPAHTANTTTGNNPGAVNANTTTPSDRNPVLADNGDVRVGKLIGSSIYNDKGDKIGSVDDVLVAADQKATHVILSIGGFLGMGAKLVSVPYDQLKFGDTNAKSENRVMLPGATRDALNNMQEFHYTNTNG